MGLLWTIYVVSELSDEARDFFERGFDVALPVDVGGRYPEEEELRKVLDGLGDCDVDYAQLSYGWQAIVARRDTAGERTTLIAPRAYHDSAARGFHLQGGSLRLVLRIVEPVAARFGPMLVCPDDNHVLVTCAAGEPPETHGWVG
jgi:hypothetical protein